MTRFGVLGHLSIEDERGARRLRGSKARRVFALLLLQANQTVTVDMLVDELWDGASPRSATATVRTHVYNVRRALGPCVLLPGSGLIETSLTGYVLRAGKSDVDADLFATLAARGQDLIERGQTEQAAAVLREALGLWRGPVLADVPCGPRLARHVAHLEETRTRALELRIDADIELGRHRNLVAELCELVAAHPYNERFHAHYMRVLHRSGRSGEALQAFRSLRSILGEELGLDPSPELQRLQHGILNAQR
jgi:DNA-binding SARP family transcriptional activator